MNSRMKKSFLKDKSSKAFLFSTGYIHKSLHTKDEISNCYLKNQFDKFVKCAKNPTTRRKKKNHNIIKIIDEKMKHLRTCLTGVRKPHGLFFFPKTKQCWKKFLFGSKLSQILTIKPINI